MLAVIIGLVFSIIGLWGIISYLPQMAIVAKGLVPFMVFVGGCISIVAGITAIRDSLDEGKAKNKENQKSENK